MDEGSIQVQADSHNAAVLESYGQSKESTPGVLRGWAESEAQTFTNPRSRGVQRGTSNGNTNRGLLGNEFHLIYLDQWETFPDHIEGS